MAVQSIAVPPDAKRDERAALLVDEVGSWPKHTLKVAWGSFEAGTVFRRANGSNGARYLVNAVACECPDYQQAGFICKHIRALVAWEAREAAVSTIVDAPATRRPAYADLFPPCKTDGCTDVAENRDGYCDRCGSDRAFEQRMADRLEARRRETVTTA